MNVNTGELLRMADYSSEFAKNFEKKGFVEVPQDMQELAGSIIDEAEARGVPAVVDLKGNSPLAKWAAKERKKKTQNKKRAQKLARRRNRK